MTDQVYEEFSQPPRSMRGFVFTNPKTGNRWYDLKKIFHRARKAAKLDHIILHDLRRSFATRARKLGIPESVIMKMTGHRTRSVFKRYNIIDEQDIRSAVELLNQNFQNGKIELAAND